MPDLSLLVNLLQLVVKDRTQLALENIALRHQLAVYKRSVKRDNGRGHREAGARRAASPVLPGGVVTLKWRVHLDRDGG
ncbi:MAG: hypothetical protein V3T22_07745, partial [Planctomycetota bacterium]